MTCSLSFRRILVLPEERERSERKEKRERREGREEGKVGTKFQHSFLFYQLYVHVSYIPFFYFILSSSSCLDLDCLLRKSLSTSSSFPQPSSSWYRRLSFIPAWFWRKTSSLSFYFPLLLFLWCPERMLSKSLQREKEVRQRMNVVLREAKSDVNNYRDTYISTKGRKTDQEWPPAPEEVLQPKLMEEKIRGEERRFEERKKRVKLWVSTWIEAGKRFSC